MRLTQSQIEFIRNASSQLLGNEVRVTLFGSRVDDHAKGGDVDLLVEVSTPIEQPALLSARLSSRISRAMNGRAVDVVLGAPNLMHHPIHDIARQNGVRL